LWTGELETAWARVYGLIASVMIEAMNRKRTRDGSLAPHTLASPV
jgi:hemoglobin-like flavoprotein